MTFEPFLARFDPRLSPFVPFLALSGAFGTFLGPKQDHFGGDFGVVLDRLWVDRGSLWGHSGIFLASV